MESRGDLYKALGVTENATVEEIKNAYRKLAKQYHPDSHPGDRKCEERFQSINEAYSILSNPEKKKAYDQAFRKTKANRETSSAASSNTYQSFGHSETFERFFGFHPDTGEIVNEGKLYQKKGNPLDTTDLFERFMGIKR